MKTYTLIPSAVAPLIMALLMPLAAPAAPPDKAHLPQDAKWVIHIDLKALSQTELVEAARDEQPQLTQLVRRWFQNRYGMNPRQDLDSLTMFSNSYDRHTGTLLLKANYDQNKVQTALEQRPDVQKEAWEGLTLYTVSADRSNLLSLGVNGQERTEPQQAEQERAAQAAAGEEVQGQPMTIALVDGQTVVIASSVERARAAVQLVRGDAPTLAQDSPLLSELEEGAMFYGAAVQLEQIEQRGGIFPILSQHERIYWQVGATDNEVVGKLQLHAKSEEIAEHMQSWLEGSVAFGQVWAADSQHLKKLVDSREVTREGKVVELTSRGDSETVRGAFGELRERFEQRVQGATN